MGNFSDRITVVQNAISDTRGNLPLILRSDNQGGIALKGSKSQDVTSQQQDMMSKCSKGQSNHCVQTIHMDDLVHIAPFKKAIIKIDIEGHEHRAFVHSLKFLQTIYVPFIFMEWMKLREYYGSEITRSQDKDLVWELVRFLEDNGFKPYSLVMGARLKTKYWYGWPDDIIWKHELQDLV